MRLHPRLRSAVAALPMASSSSSTTTTTTTSLARGAATRSVATAAAAAAAATRTTTTTRRTLSTTTRVAQTGAWRGTQQQQQQRSSFAAAAALATAVALSTTTTSPPQAEEAAPPATTPTPEQQQQEQDHAANGTLSPDACEVRYFAAFLHTDAREEFLACFPPTHANVVADHMTVAYNPKDERLAMAASNLGRPVDVMVLAIVKDDFCETALVRVDKLTKDDDGGLPFPPENEHPHVTLSLARLDDPEHQAVYSNELLRRVMRETNGEVRDFADGKGTTMMVLAHPYRLHTTACVSDLWRRGADRCGEPECGFCRFMKMGPCGKEFAAWEACLDACKEKDEDFVEKCAPQTLALKACVDVNPKYYYAVLDGGGASGEEAPQQA